MKQVLSSIFQLYQEFQQSQQIRALRIVCFSSIFFTDLSQLFLINSLIISKQFVKTAFSPAFHVR